MLDPKASMGDKLKALPGITAFYAGWYPKLWMGFTSWFRYGKFGSLAGHVRYADRAARRLARTVFHLMLRHQAGLEKRQAVLFRTVDIAMELAVMVATVVRAQKLVDDKAAHATQAVALTDTFCRDGKRLVESKFRELWVHDDVARYRTGQRVLDGSLDWVTDASVEAPGAVAEGQQAAK
jgi:hypothetical protein